jgi:hypothetical protein
MEMAFRLASPVRSRVEGVTQAIPTNAAPYKVANAGQKPVDPAAPHFCDASSLSGGSASGNTMVV